MTIEEIRQRLDILPSELFKLTQEVGWEEMLRALRQLADDAKTAPSSAALYAACLEKVKAFDDGCDLTPAARAAVLADV